ncbi:GNAT family N-acetyltransferase [Streptomyces sp. NPDC018031]|uniref:GNAT family N-acetyltransferase n=1 Tax=Streptomyces sp. NPDC018031 TaxID=3365033 RepID=UPI00379070B7
MPTTQLRRIAAFRAAFARRQATEVIGVPGGSAVLHPTYAASYEHNEIVIDGTPRVAELPALADSVLGHLPHRRISVLDDAVGTECAPVLTAAGYTQETLLIMVYGGGGAGPAEVPPARQVELVEPAELLPSVSRQLRTWMPEADDEVIRQLAERRHARLRGADEVCFLASRDEASGAVAGWADLYLDRSTGTAQIEELVTDDAHTRRGHAGAVLAAAVRRAAGCDLLFLLADAADWPHGWYTRTGFTTIGRTHVFTRA